MSLILAKRAGLDIEGADDALDRAMSFLDSMTNNATGYVGDTERPAARDDTTRKPLGPTAVALACRLAMGQTLGRGSISKAVEILSEDDHLPVWKKTWVRHDDETDLKLDLHYFYWGSMAMAQVGGEPWKKWYTALQEGCLARAQKPSNGNYAYWSHVGRFHLVGGYPYATSLVLLSLSAPHRYLD